MKRVSLNTFVRLVEINYLSIVVHLIGLNDTIKRLSAIEKA